MPALASRPWVKLTQRSKPWTRCTVALSLSLKEITFNSSTDVADPLLLPILLRRFSDLSFADIIQGSFLREDWNRGWLLHNSVIFVFKVFRCTIVSVLSVYHAFKNHALTQPLLSSTDQILTKEMNTLRVESTYCLTIIDVFSNYFIE